MQYYSTAVISLRSKVRRDLLAYFYLNRSARVYVRQLARAIGADSTNLARELARLEQEGLLHSETEGRQRYYNLNKAYPHLNAVLSLLHGRVGLEATIAAALKQIGGLNQVFVFGSFAKGEADATSDIDLLVIGNPEPAALAQVVSRLEKLVHREVNYTVLSPRELKSKLATKDPFMLDVWNGRRIGIPLDGQDATTSGKSRAGKALPR